jgi:hypothetical protein
VNAAAGMPHVFVLLVFRLVVLLLDFVDTDFPAVARVVVQFWVCGEVAALVLVVVVLGVTVAVVVETLAVLVVTIAVLLVVVGALLFVHIAVAVVLALHGLVGVCYYIIGYLESYLVDLIV